MAVAASSKVSEEERAWAYHLSLDRAETDYNNELMLAERKGGVQRAYDIARRMLSAGKYSQEEVSEATGLSVEDVRSLQGA